MSSSFESLPLFESAVKIREEISKNQNLLLTAPTGSGKSTFVPWLLSTHAGDFQKVAVLEPRRLAAVRLSGYLARFSGKPEGETVGYRIRFESLASDRTKILFTTYGNFLQSVLHGNESFDWIVFDEFHERKVEMDLLLAHTLALQKIARETGKPAPRIAVLSAELNREELERILEVPCLKVGKPGFPVQILNQESPVGTPLAQNVEKAVRTLERNQIAGSTLVFLPGKGEISSVHRHLDETLGQNRYRILELYGGQEKSAEAEIFADAGTPKIILSTNIAETSLTIPGITGVIDSGLERSTEFSAKEDRNILKLSRISLQNAVQRTGRAGRTQAGVCIRLWSAREEANFAKSIEPEILKTDLRPALLKLAALAHVAGISPSEFSLPTVPDKTLAEKALGELQKLKFICTESGSITELGRRILEIPLNDLSLAKCFAEAGQLSKLSLALFAVLDSEDTARKERSPQNALELAEDLARGTDHLARDTRLSFRRLCEFVRNHQAKFPIDDPTETARIFFKAFPQALAIRSGKTYRTQSDIFAIEPSQVENAAAILVFHLLRTNSAQKSEMRMSLYVKIPAEWIENETADIRYELLWRSGQERYIGLEIRSVSGAEISRQEILPQNASKEILEKLKALTGQTWMERHRRENLSHLWMDDANRILLCKMKLASATFPEFSLPEWNGDDMDLVTEDFMDGIFLMRDLSAERFRQKMIEYFGENMMGWLKKMFPDSLSLPNGKRARYLYAEGSPVELSARIEDFLPFRGEHTIAEGKIKVRYDILAPNFRTAQKTWDLTGFWKNTYPQIRKELRGRYPKHPWPETVID